MFLPAAPGEHDIAVDEVIDGDETCLWVDPGEVVRLEYRRGGRRKWARIVYLDP